RKAGGSHKVYWQGPSIGFDFGGNASKVFTLVYNLADTEALFQRYPGVDGSIYVVAGLGVNYQQAGEVIMAPIRTGVGLRAGASVGYLHYSKKHSWIPF
ncbi:MAG: EipA family protein, partial [Rhodospirillales bacterium]